MKLSEWAKENGVSYKTAWRWFKNGTLPVPAEQTESGTILVKKPKAERRLLIADSAELKDDLVQDMIEVLTSFCARLYGRRSAKNRAKIALKAIQNEDPDRLSV